MKTNRLFYWPLMLVVFVSGLVFTGCSEENEEPASITPSSVSLYVGDKAYLTYIGGKCTWTSETPFIASVTNEGKVTGNKVGSTIIKANELSCKVTVKGRYNTYKEPCVKWGSSIDYVDFFMDGYLLEKNYSDRDGLIYIGSGKVKHYIYLFDNDKLQSSTVMISTDYSEEVAGFLSERYAIISYDIDNYSFTFVDHKKEKCIFVKIYNLSYLQITYTDYPKSRGDVITKSNINIIENEGSQLDKSIIFKQFSESLEQ